MSEIDTIVVIADPNSLLSVTSETELDAIVAVEALPSVVVTIDALPTVVTTENLLDSRVIVAEYAPGPQGPRGVGIPDGGDPGDLVSRTVEGTEWLAPEARLSFLVSDWLGPFAGNYELPFQHNLDADQPTVETLSGGNVFITERRIDDANMITLLVPAVPDLRFSGLVRVLRN